MAIKCLANKVLEFKRDNEKVKTTLGFCELPNWVASTRYYKLAVVGGSIKPFDGQTTDEEVLKENEKVEALRAEYKALEEKIEMAKSKGQEKVDALRAEVAELEAKKEELSPSEETEPTVVKNRR